MGIKIVEPVKTQSLDHLGIISAVARRLGLVEKIDQRLPITRKTHITMGHDTSLQKGNLFIKKEEKQEQLCKASFG